MLRYEQNQRSFEVSEELLYTPSGQGEHVYARCRKWGISTLAMKRRLGETIGLSPDRISHAGMKDAQATAVQWLSWPKTAQRGEPQSGEGYELLELSQHENALHLGHVRANHFVLTLEGDGPLPAREVLAAPFANFYGRQRFGREPLPDVDTLWRLARRSRENVSVLQSKLFNAYLRWRLASGDLGQRDDELWTNSNGRRCFAAARDAELDERFARGEIAPTGPLFGYKVKLSSSELAFLADQSLEVARFRSFGKQALGARRPLLVWPELDEPVCQDGTIRLSLRLPSGAFATVWLTQVFLPQQATASESAWPDFTQPVQLVPASAC